MKKRSDYSILQELERDLDLTYARFGKINGTPPDDPLPTTEEEVDAFIRRRTRTYFLTWLVPRIHELQARENARHAKRKARGRR